MTRDAAPTLTVRITGAPEIECTAEHPFYVRERNVHWDNEHRRYSTSFAEPRWVEAKSLTKEMFVAMPLGSDGSSVPAFFRDRDQGFWEFIGRYLADGWTRVGSRSARLKNLQYKVTVCDGHGQRDDLLRCVRAAGFHVTVDPSSRTAIKAIISHKELALNMRDHFGCLSTTKQVPEFVFSLSLELREALMRGFLAGDGHFDGCYRSFVSVNRGLINNLQRLWRGVRGHGSVVHRNLVAPQKIIEGRTVRQRPWYRVDMVETPVRARTFVESGVCWCPVRSVTATGRTERVFNIEVEEDHSYVAEGCAVHNCQPASSAGHRKGIDDERWLWPDVARILRGTRPRWCVFENVRGLLSVNRGQAFDQILRDLSVAGYDAGWFLVRASDVGAPHRRERVFILGRRRDAGVEPLAQWLRSIEPRAVADGGRTGREERGETHHNDWRDASRDDALGCGAFASRLGAVGNVDARGRDEGRRAAGKHRKERAYAEERQSCDADAEHRGATGATLADADDDRCMDPSYASGARCEGGDLRSEAWQQRDRTSTAHRSAERMADADGEPERGPNDEDAAESREWSRLCAPTDRARGGRSDTRDSARGAFGDAGQRGLVRAIDGLSLGLDGRAEAQGSSILEATGREVTDDRRNSIERGWPAKPQEEQHPWEAPRTTKRRASNWVERVSALGNAVVPAVARRAVQGLVALDADMISSRVE